MTSQYQVLTRLYHDMAEIGYRPEAASDGFGNITTSDDSMAQIRIEADSWASRHPAVHDEFRALIGVPDFNELRNFAIYIEAARFSCSTNRELAEKILGLTDRVNPRQRISSR